MPSAMPFNKQNPLPNFSDSHKQLPQRHITTRIMQQWPQHQQTAANPPSRRAQEVHQLHCPQSVPTLAEYSALRRNMPQRNDESEDALKKHRISFSPAGAVWGQMGQAWISDSRNFYSCARHTQALTQSDYVAFCLLSVLWVH